MNSAAVGMVSTLHVTSDAYLHHLPTTIPQLQTLYRFLAVVATPQSDPRTLLWLEGAGVVVARVGSAEIGSSRRAALQLGLDQGDAGHIHYCDFDRLLHWQMHCPDELQQVVTAQIPLADYSAIGRTEAALATHPPVQIACETLTNRVCSHTLGRSMDVTAGSNGTSIAAAAHIVAHSSEVTNATDCEWPLLIDNHPALSLQFIATDGLSFETATFFGEGVYAQADSAENWGKRVQLARESVDAVLRLDQRGAKVST